MKDTLPNETLAWKQVETRMAACMDAYGYQEIRLPILESTALFKRSLGEITDIIEKEMYTFDDLNGDSLTLRPEGTAGCVRACLEHGLLHNQQQKLWYLGPMFRHEKPQKGRYRQFNQFGAEVFGIDGLGIELELILLCKRLFDTLGLSDLLSLQINTLGTLHERLVYKETLIDYLKPQFEKLDPDSQRRLHRNPLRILDSKHPEMQSLIANAPCLIDSLGNESRDKFTQLCEGLDELNIKYSINSQLVRGLDYYDNLVFEWVTTQLGSQATVCAGGRYDALVEQLGGKKTPAIGFAMGMERLMLLLASTFPKPIAEESVFMMAETNEAMKIVLLIAEDLRNELPNWRIVVNTALGSFKSQFKKADKSGARLALIIGEHEMAEKLVSIKDLREVTEQKKIPLIELVDYIKRTY